MPGSKSRDSGGVSQSGVVYVGHLPHGFYEQEIKGYFSQFGTVNKVKVARNKKNGHCKGYAFIEFEYDEVAKIVAQTMNNYLMFNKLLKCQYVEPTAVHRGMLGGRFCLHRKISLASRYARSQQQHNKNHTASEHRRRIKRLLYNEKKMREKLAVAGVNYDFPGYQSCVGSEYKKPSHILFEQQSGIP